MGGIRARGLRTAFLSRAISYGGRAIRNAIHKPNKLDFRMRTRGTQASVTASRSGRSADYGGTTFQNDRSTLYYRKRAPRRVRRRTRKFIKRLTWGLDKLQGMRTCVIVDHSNHALTPTSHANAQAIVGITLYGYGANQYASNINTGNGDMPWIFARESGAYPAATSADRKLRFRSAVMNVTLKNKSTLNSLVVDVYHLLCIQSGDTDDASGDPATNFNEAIAAQLNGNMPTAITNGQYEGVTPFDAPDFGRSWKIKNVQQYRLSPEGYFFLQLRDPGNYVLNAQDVLEMDHKKYLTEGYLFVAYNPDYVDGEEYRGPVDFDISANKKYHYTETTGSTNTIGV